MFQNTSVMLKSHFLAATVCTFFLLNTVSTSNVDGSRRLSVRGLKCKSNSDCGPKESCAWLFGSCNRLACWSDNECFSNEFCNKQKRRKSGKCARKTEDGTLCFFNIEYNKKN